jgi:hypothetical protein
MSDLIFFILFAEHNDIEHENVKKGKLLTNLSIPERKLMPLRFFGPIFLSSATEKTSPWKIELVEGVLAEKDSNVEEFDIIQSFFILNSSISYEGSPTHLSVLIGSPYTEDIDFIHNKIKEYIHPCIIQNKIVNESIYAGEFNYTKSINQELIRGSNLIEFSIGSSWKPHWHKKKKYNCIAIIERIKSKEEKGTYFYTFDPDSKIRKSILDKIPSYYLLSILPGYYEELMGEVLTIFGKHSLYPNIARIIMKNQDDEVLYLEEFIVDKGEKRNLGCVLIIQKETEEGHSTVFYKKKLRQILDKGKDFARTVIEINKDINPFKRWKTDTGANLKEIQEELDDQN